MIFAKKKKKILVWCDDPPEDRVISIVAGCLANHDRAHSLYKAYSAVGSNTDNSQTLRVPHGSRPHGHDKTLVLCVNDPACWMSTPVL